MTKQAIETMKSAKQAGFTLIELTAAIVSRRLRDACDQQNLIVQNIAMKREGDNSKSAA